MADQLGQGAPEAAAQGKGASALVVQINAMLQQLGQMLDQSDAIGDDSKAKFGEILSQYQDFVEGDLGGAPGSKPQEPMPANAPMETQGKKAMPAM